MKPKRTTLREDILIALREAGLCNALVQPVHYSSRVWYVFEPISGRGIKIGVRKSLPWKVAYLKLRFDLARAECKHVWVRPNFNPATPSNCRLCGIINPNDKGQ